MGESIAPLLWSMHPDKEVERDADATATAVSPVAPPTRVRRLSDPWASAVLLGGGALSVGGGVAVGASLPSVVITLPLCLALVFFGGVLWGYYVVMLFSPAHAAVGAWLKTMLETWVRPTPRVPDEPDEDDAANMV